MTIVVQVTVNGSTWWKKTSAGWSEVDQSKVDIKEPVWVVTDLAEETFTELSVPRIFGADRKNFILRQLANRFPESVFRIALPPPQTGGLMDRLAPPSQTLTAVEPADRVELALAKIKSPIAGVWSTSMLMARIGQRKSMPQHLFVILSQPNGLRILFIKHRVPVLTRLVTSAEKAQEQASEVIRTLRHLENTHVVERNSDRFGVLLMGGKDDFANKLAEDRLTLLRLPKKWQNQTIENWCTVLFDEAVNKPPGQLAPLKYRTTYLAKQISSYAKLSIIFMMLSMSYLLVNSVLNYVQNKQKIALLQQQLNLQNEEIKKTEGEISTYGVMPDMVRKAVAIDNAEIEKSLDMTQNMMQVSEVISKHPNLRLKTWLWKLVNSDEPICNQEGVNAPQVISAGMNMQDMPIQDMSGQDLSAQETKRRVEIKLTITFPETLSPSQLEQQTIDISNGFKKIKGLKLHDDPVKSLSGNSISVGSIVKTVTLPGKTWCMSLPNSAEKKHE